MSMREVKEITYNQTKPFLLNIHYARRMPCIQYAYGLFIDRSQGNPYPRGRGRNCDTSYKMLINQYEH